jgi:hypothetical protein
MPDICRQSSILIAAALLMALPACDDDSGGTANDDTGSPGDGGDDSGADTSADTGSDIGLDTVTDLAGGEASLGILFVTQFPIAADFTTIGSVFGNHEASLSSVVAAAFVHPILGWHAAQSHPRGRLWPGRPTRQRCHRRARPVRALGR